MKGEPLKGHLDMLILAAVRNEPRHGYAIIDSLRLRSRGVFDLAEGTIYPALHRLERAGLLASRWAEHEGRRRRVYRLTRSGRAALADQAEQWSLFSRAVAAVVGTTT
jgi:transcriptional regulator